MTSKERREARYERRTAIRSAKKAAKQSVYDQFDKVFSYDHLYASYRKVRQNVAWKTSVQNYITQAPLNVFRTYQELQNGSFKSDGFFEFELFERGKRRHIRSVTIRERVVQRCLCDYALVPALSRTFIFDNGASLKGKGYSFSMRRLEQHLRQYVRLHGSEGYVLIFDFSKFFDNISHKVVKEIIQREFTDQRIISLADHFIDAFGDAGMGLGSQISQILALASANRLDHAIKERMGIRWYGRYMDDGYLLHTDKEHLKKCMREIQSICSSLGICLNTKKTQIVKLSHGFTFLHAYFRLTPSGKVVKTMKRTNTVRMRRKLKSMFRLLAQKRICTHDINEAFQSWRTYAQGFCSYRTVQSMEMLYTQLLSKEVNTE